MRKAIYTCQNEKLAKIYFGAKEVNNWVIVDENNKVIKTLHTIPDDVDRYYMLKPRPLKKSAWINYVIVNGNIHVKSFFALKEREIPVDIREKYKKGIHFFTDDEGIFIEVFNYTRGYCSRIYKGMIMSKNEFAQMVANLKESGERLAKIIDEEKDEGILIPIEEKKLII